jgi:enolase
MAVIQQLYALEILDSRGRPTVQTTCWLAGGASATASVPSGASTGAAEALELRDGDASRYAGLGCRRAVHNVNTTIQDALAGIDFANQAELDQAMCLLDGAANKSNLGANAILSVSLAFAKSSAIAAGIPLYQQFSTLLAADPSPLQWLPRPTINLFSGGKHAGGQVPIQDVLVVPAGANTIDEAMAMTYAVFQAAAALCLRKYQMRPLRADEGGLAPPFPNVTTMLDDAVTAIEEAGFRPGEEVALAVDVAASHFYRSGAYFLDPDHPIDSQGMIDTLHNWLDRYPIVSVEDGLAEEDWAHWPALCQAFAGRALVLGDDFLCTNPQRIARASAAGAATALLLKVNQIGTLTEAANACRLARAAGWSVTVSARSGETEDNWLADLAVGWQGDQLKVGSITQSERLAKYNRLLAIEAEAGLPVIAWPDTTLGNSKLQ